MKKVDLESRFKNNILFVGIILIFIIGSWLRIEGILTRSFAFTYDVGRDLIEVGKIVNFHTIPLIGQTTGLAGLFYGPWWNYILTLPFAISGGDPQGVALFIALTGITVFLTGFWLGKKIGGIFLSIALGTLLCVSPAMIGLSAQIWSPNIAPVLIIAILGLLYPIFKNDSLSNGIVSGILGFLLGLLLDAEIVFAGLLIVSIVITLAVVLRKKLLTKNAVFIVIGFFITLLPRIIFEFRHHFIMTKTLLAPSHSGTSLHFFPSIPTIKSISQLFFSTFTDTFVRGNYWISGVVVILTVCSYLFFFNKANQIEKQFTVLNIVAFFVFFILLCFYGGPVYGHFIIGLPLFFVFFVAIGFNLAKKGFGQTNAAAVALALFALAVFNPIERISSIGQPLWEGNAAVYRNQLAVIDYVYQDARGKDFNYIVYTPAVIDYTYQYLTKWYGKKKYGYVPESKTQKLFYVILEPDYELPSRLVDWLKLREGDGQVIKNTLVKGGIRVQRRIRK